jgi:SagB-type dehydrogenase family enzyme
MARAGAIWNRTVVRKRVAVSVTLALLLAVSLTFLTGFVAAALDLNRFAYHKYAAYLAIALAAAHIILHWRSLTAQVQRWLVGQPGPVPARIDSPIGRSAAPRLPRRGLLWPALSFVAGAGLGRLASPRGAAVALEPGEDLGQIYHQWSKPDYAGLLVKSINARPQPTPYKEYADATFLPLPTVPAPHGPPLEAVIQQRRSIREYAARSLTLDELSRLLHFSAGITDRRDPTLAFRAVPSSGALFPIEVYPVLFNVAGAPPGAYHYDVQRHRLALVRSGDFRQEVFRAAVSQEMIQGASLVFVLTGIFERVQWKYLDRSYRYLLLEAGHLGQNVYLAATALGLGPCGIGAFFDDDLNRLLQLDGQNEAVVYLLAVGPLPA